MTSVPSPEELPRGSTAPQDPAVTTGTELFTKGAVPVVVVVSATWAGPSRPAPTVLRELGRRWGDQIKVLLVEEPSDDVLDAWGIEVLPTWLRFLPGTAERSGNPGGEGDESILTVSDLAGTALDGRELVLPGPWRLEHRRTGALPKHVIEAEFGPSA